jgi:hypothetical protein
MRWFYGRDVTRIPDHELEEARVIIRARRNAYFELCARMKVAPHFSLDLIG